MSGKRQLTAIIERDGDGYVALCAELPAIGIAEELLRGRVGPRRSPRRPARREAERGGRVAADPQVREDA
jgi:hypothetical protein